MVVGIIGILAAVAIPAYQTYQDNARENVAQGTINIIKKAFVSCRALNSFALCATATINGTLEQQDDAPITHVVNGTTAACWSVAVENAVDDTGGTKCVQFGSTNTTPTAETSDGTSSKDGTCTASTGVCA